jgi:hypothetical protein
MQVESSDSFFLYLLFDTEDGSDVLPRKLGSLRTSWYYNPEDLTLHSHRPENLVSCWWILPSVLITETLLTPLV